MADINQTYAGVLEYFDPKADSGVLNPSTLSWFGTGGSNFWLSEMPFWDQLNQLNIESASTIEGVKVPYPGTNRAGWINERIAAINTRYSFISNRLKQLLDQLKQSGISNYDSIAKGVTAALSVIPIVGSIVTSAGSQAAAAKQLDQFKQQTLIQAYTDDLKQLAVIRSGLVAELTTAPTAGSTDEPVNNAASVTPTYFYVIAAAILVLFLYLVKRKGKRRKR